MDKDEILMKSRMENRGRDMPKIEEGKNSARFAIIAGNHKSWISFSCHVS